MRIDIYLSDLDKEVAVFYHRFSRVILHRGNLTTC